MLEQIIEDIKNAKSDKEIKKVLCEMYVVILLDSKVRKEFDDYISKIPY